MPSSDRAPHEPLAWWRARSPLGRARRDLLISLVVLAGAAWAFTLHQSLELGAPADALGGGMPASAMQGMQGMEGMRGMEGMAMGGMPAGGWSAGAALVFVGVWAVMMAAMMLPSAAPMILTFATAQARRDRSTAVPTWLFVAGYLLVWSAIGAAVYALVQAGAEVSARVGAIDRAVWGPLALGLTLVGAGVYQFTPIKRVCLHHCRSPMAFVALYWRDGPAGAVRMGIRHGAYCLGCCWALFAILTVAGIMSLAWMLALTLVVFVEKTFPHGERVSAAIGAGLIALGLAVAVRSF